MQRAGISQRNVPRHLPSKRGRSKARSLQCKKEIFRDWEAFPRDCLPRLQQISCCVVIKVDGLREPGPLFPSHLKAVYLFASSVLGCPSGFAAANPARLCLVRHP